MRNNEKVKEQLRYKKREVQEMTRDLTEGSCLKQILLFTAALLVGNLLQQTYNLVDAAIVGRCPGPDALAAVGASSSVQFLVLGFCIGACAGFGIPLSFDHFSGYTVYAVIQSGSRNAACGGRQ